MYILRNYQKKAVDKGLHFIKDKSNKKKPVIVAPTAAGKSLIVAAIADGEESPIIVLQPSKELLMQNYNKYVSFGNEAKIFSASLQSKEIGHVTFATIGSIVSRVEDFKKKGVKVVLIDEAHLMSKPSGQINTFLKALGNVKVIGLTATPVVLNNTLEGVKLQMVNRTRKSLWNHILHVTQIKELVDEGFWAKLVYDVVDLNEKNLKYNVSRSEFTEQSIEQVYEDNDIDTLIIKKVEEIRDTRKHILIFCPSIEKAKELQTKIDNSTVVWGTMPNAERDIAIKEFKEGITQVMINVLVLSVGFDMEWLDCVIDSVPTASIGRYYQKNGRAVRIWPTKKDSLLVDFSGNYNRFGKLEDITFEDCEGIGWGMFSKNILLTGIPVDQIGTILKPTKEIIEQKQIDLENPLISFGRHKGKRLKDIPRTYSAWLLENFTWSNHNKDLKNAITKLLS